MHIHLGVSRFQASSTWNQTIANPSSFKQQRAFTAPQGAGAVALGFFEDITDQGFGGESGLRLGLVAMGGQLEVLSGCTLVSLFFEQNIHGLIHA